MPLSGQTYTANSVFGLGSNLGSSNFVVYAGSGESVTVTGLQGGITYYAAFFAMSNSAGVFSYNQQTTTPQVSRLVGALQDVALRVSGNGRIPLGRPGARHCVLLRRWNAGRHAVRDSHSDNPAVVAITNVNNLNALSLGTANITAVYGDKTNTVAVTVDHPTYVENFDAAHMDGTMWDGVYFGSSNNFPLATGFSFPNASMGVGEGQTVVCDANLSAPGELAVQSSGIP